jgi:hypothetical protein
MGFCTASLLMYGGLKLWFTVHSDPKNMEKFTELLNEKEQQVNGFPSRAVLVSKTCCCLPSELEARGIKFSVVICIYYSQFSGNGFYKNCVLY